MRIWAMLVAAVLPMTACSAQDSRGIDVVTSFYPLQWVSERIAGSNANVTNLTAPGREPHDLELTIRQTAAVGDADLVVYERGLQPAVDEAVRSTGARTVVDALAVARTQQRDGTTDPHIWLDPRNMVRVAEAVAKQLAELDPSRAATYQARLARLRTQLLALDVAYGRQLQRCALRTVVVSHDAFGYLPAPFRFEAIAGLSPNAEPSPARLAELRDLIRSQRLTTVFAERLASPAMADTLAASAGVRTAVLDPIEGLSEQTANEDYLSLMRENLAALRKANQCR